MSQVRTRSDKAKKGYCDPRKEARYRKERHYTTENTVRHRAAGYRRWNRAAGRASMDDGTVVAQPYFGREAKDWTMMSHLLSVACFPGFLDGSIAVWTASLTLHREGEG
jgi:hypothetical protein